MRNVLIINAESIKSLSIIRAFKDTEYNVFTISFEKLTPAAFSKYNVKNFFLKTLNLKKINEIILQNKIDVVLPLESESIYFFIKNKTKILSKKLILPDLETFQTLNNKENALKFANKLNIKTPFSVFPKNLNELHYKLKNSDIYPLIIKPKTSSGSRGIFVINNSKYSIKKVNKIVKRYGLPIIQEYIPKGGISVGVEFLYYEGKSIVTFSHMRMREFPIKGGPSTYCKNYVNTKLITISKKILDKVNYNGFAMVEYKQHPVTKEFYFIEVNPRPWGSISLPIYCGYNFPLKYAELIINNQEGNNKYCNIINYSRSDKNKYMRWFLPADIIAILFNPKFKFKFKIKELFRKYPNTVYKIIDKSDIVPAIIFVFKLVIKLFSYKFIKFNLLRK